MAATSKSPTMVTKGTTYYIGATESTDGDAIEGNVTLNVKLNRY